MFSLKEILTASMVLFAIIDILGNIPVIINIREKTGSIQSGKTTLISGIIMILFLFLGKTILSLIGIDINSFAVAGSFVLFFLAIEMILGISLFKNQETSGTASVVPLAFPVIAGPGSMTSLLSLRAEYQLSNIIVAVFFNLIVVYIVLRLSKKIGSILGQTGINISRKVFGIVLLSIAIKLFAANVTLIIK